MTKREKARIRQKVIYLIFLVVLSLSQLHMDDIPLNEMTTHCRVLCEHSEACYLAKGYFASDLMVCWYFPCNWNA